MVTSFLSVSAARANSINYPQVFAWAFTHQSGFCPLDYLQRCCLYFSIFYSRSYSPNEYSFVPWPRVVFESSAVPVSRINAIFGHGASLVSFSLDYTEIFWRFKLWGFDKKSLCINTGSLRSLHPFLSPERSVPTPVPRHVSLGLASAVVQRFLDKAPCVANSYLLPFFQFRTLAGWLLNKFLIFSAVV
jgi:hypothetical protein